MDSPTPPPRDDNGRFAPGNAGGPGRSKGRGYELQRAAQEAVTPEHVAAVMRKALRMALEEGGNLAAMRFVIERTCGRPPEAPANGVPLGIDPLKLRTVADCTAAIQKLTDAMIRGELDVVQGKVLLDAVVAQARLIEGSEIEKRLAELEQQAKRVDFRERGA